MYKYHRLSLLLIFTLLCSTHYLDAQCFSQQTYTIPGTNTFVVPGTNSETYLIEIEVRGADGGDFLWGGNPQTDGGEGASLKGSFLVDGGSSLFVIVGQSGFDAPGSPGGGGGGGGSAVIINSSDVLIAAAAGGGGGQGAANTGKGGKANTNSPAQGGAGPGASGGGGFNAPGANGAAGSGGGAGTLINQGTGGIGGVTAGGGGNGFGGGGGGSGTGGGGGGGYQGGDGAESGDLSGKGGDSYLNTLYSGTIIFNTAGSDGGGNNLNGEVIITCVPTTQVEISLVSSTNLTCFGDFTGSIEVTATGGLAPYQFALNGGNFGDDFIFTNLQAGDYTVTVMDANSGTSSLMVTISSPEPLLLDLISVEDNPCFGGSEGAIEVIGSGGTSISGNYNYSINGSPVQMNGDFNGLANGFYVISVFDDNICTAQITAEIESPGEISIVISKESVTCFGGQDGSITVLALGGSGNFLYSLDGGDFVTTDIFLDLASATYSIVAMDDAGCTEEVLVFLGQPEELELDAEIENVSCFNDVNGSIDAFASGGTPPYMYSLDGSDFDENSFFDSLASGMYLLVVKDDAACTSAIEVEITASDSLILSVNILNGVECGGSSSGEVELVLEGGVGAIVFAVDSSENMTGLFSGLSGGDHMAFAEDENGCSVELPFNIPENSNIEVSIDSTLNVSCSGGNDGFIKVEVVGGTMPYMYCINGGPLGSSTSFENLEAGTYSIGVVDSLGCISGIEISISEAPLVVFDYLDKTDIDCYGDTTGTITFSLDGGNLKYLLVSDGDTLIFEASDTLSLGGLSAGAQILAFQDENGCTLIDTISLSQNDSLFLSIDSIFPSACGLFPTGYVDLNAMGGLGPYTYSLLDDTNGTGEFNNLYAGVTTAIVTDNLGCQTSLEFEILKEDGLVVDTVITSDLICFGSAEGTIEILASGGNGNIKYELNGLTNVDGYFDGLPAGVYTINMEDGNFCELSVEVEVFELDEIFVDIVDYSSNPVGPNFIDLLVYGGAEPYTYSVTDDSTTITQDSTLFTGLYGSIFHITVTDANGCTAEQHWYVVDVSDLEEEIGLQIYPNPTHDYFIVLAEVQSNERAQIEVLDISGSKIFSLSNVEMSLLRDGLKIDVSSLESGSYFLQFRSEGKRVVRKFIVVK